MMMNDDDDDGDYVFCMYVYIELGSDKYTRSVP